MVIRHFLRWIGNARVADRVAAASALSHAFLDPNMPFEDRCEAEAALTLLLDDPSSKVRLAMAEALSMSRHAPPQMIAALARDQEEVAGVVLMRSPLLSDLDLIDLVATARPGTQETIASRPLVSMSLSAAIAEVGGETACLRLVENDGAEIASLSFRRIAERHGHCARLRETMLKHRDLPPDCRHMLMMKLSEALKQSPLVLALMGPARAERVTREACVCASVALIDHTRAQEHAALVEHLRLRGDLTVGFLVRAVARGKVDFLGSVLVALSGQPEARVRSLLAKGRDVALGALLRSAGLPERLHGIILCALKVWRDVATGKRVAGAQEVSWLMLVELNATPGQSGPAEADRELAALVKSIHLDALRENARMHAVAIAAA
ncbi:DUF2336 domain-containing protein [Aquamicrobium sp. LC103]|uniref:DUF2336 domain-containing protein n=1 Tax=Aquamicrobium sp. LC103 TaxID=1120658 RepID=UPI00063EA7DF|nr:DUF2336 domain-containing protein [Aquamicrobium sp. LC103]TKT76808.1 DUF2336 domain-containing protein [Aquamicrobium sp. LC103]